MDQVTHISIPTGYTQVITVELMGGITQALGCGSNQKTLTDIVG
jgi:hypothetical protein